MQTRRFISLVTVFAFLVSALIVGNVSAFTTEQEATIYPFAKGFEDGTMTGVRKNFMETNTVVSDVAHDGTKSLKVSDRQNVWEGPQVDLAGKLEKGKTYYWSAWVYHDSDEPQGFKLTGYSCDDSTEDRYASKFYTQVAANLEVPSKEWVRLEGLYTYQYEGNPVAAAMIIEADAMGFDFYVDDIVVAGPALVNSNFEEGNTKGWTTNGAFSITASTEVSMSGDYSMKVADRANYWEGPVVDLAGKMVKGQTYYASAWVYQDSGEAQDFKFTAYARDDSSENPYDGKFYTTIEQNEEVPSGVWTRLEGYYTYNYTGVPMGLTFYIEAPEVGYDFYVDNVVISGQNIMESGVICDAGFEGSYDGWTAQGTGKDATLSINDTTAHDGLNSLLVTGRADTWQGARYDLVGKVTKGQVIDLSMWVYQTTGKPQEIRVSVCSDSEGDPAYSTIAVDSAVPSRTWVELKGSYTASYTGEVEQLFIYVESSNPTMDIGIDDVLITTPVVKDEIEKDIPSLKDVYADYFPIGVAVPPSAFDNELQSDLIKKHFNSITAENDMKPLALQPKEGDFKLEKGDKYVEFAQENGMRLRGHTLLWHQAVPDWIFVDDEGEFVTREVLLERMKTHIETIIKHYGDKVEVWDVVNEAIGDNQPYGLRDTKWKQIIGDDYVIKAFEYAYEALVEAGLEDKVKLYYNDYNNEESPLKREAILKLVKELKENTKIVGVGYQCHVGVGFGSVEGIRESLKGYLDLGLEVEITELDMTVYGSFFSADAPISEEQLINQGYKHYELAEMLKKLDQEYPDKIKGLTFWGLKDDMSWLNYTTDEGRTDVPLLFDKHGKAKYAYWGMVDATKLPVLVKNVKVFKGTPVVDGQEDSVWDLAKYKDVMDSDGQSRGSFKTLWDDNNLYVYLTTKGDLSKVEFFVDEDNSKDDKNEAEDKYITVTGKGAVTGSATAKVEEVEGGYVFEVCIPFTNTPSSKLGFDVRLNFGEGETAELVSWNDIKNNQDNSTSGYGVLGMISPKYVEAIKGTPVIDGEIDTAWESANEISTDIVTQGTEPSKATVKTMWDEDYLYVLAKVADKTLCATGANPWENDSMEFFVDENNGRTTAYEGDDAQYRVNYKNEQSFGGNAITDKFQTVTKAVYDGETAIGYLVEAAIPFATINGSVDHIMGFDLQVNDDSNADGVRDGMSNWCDATGDGWKNTEAFGLLKFVSSSTAYKVSGYIQSDFEYQDEKGTEIESGFVVEIVGTDLKAISDNGYFEITGVPENADGYTLKITKANYLAREIKDVAVTGNTEVSTESSPVMMWVGDVAINGVQDNAINMADIVYICKSFNTVKGDTRYKDESDLNKDGAVNMEDIVLVGKHFNRVSADYNK